jgi:hypothetical protein
VPPVTAGQFYKINTLTGMPVALGERSLGKVSEVVINDGGCVQYLVVQSGPDAFVAVPWGAATVDFARKSIALHAPDVTPDQIRLATFTAATWPTFTDPAWSERTLSMWGTSSPRVGAGSRAAEAATGAPGTTPATGTPPTPRIGPTGTALPSTGAPGTGVPGTGGPATGTPRPGTPGTTPGTGTPGTSPGTGTPGKNPGTTPPAPPPAGTPGKGGPGGSGQ